MNRVELETLGEQIAEHAAHLDAATHRLLVDIRTFDTAAGWYAQGARSCAQWLSWRVGWDPGTAREHVRVARCLAELPLIDDALRRGQTSYSKVRAMTRVATPANEAMLLEQSQYTTGAQLERICQKYAWVNRHDDGYTPKDDASRRYVSRRDTADGMVHIDAILHPEEAAMVWAALERVATQRCLDRDLAREYETSRAIAAERAPAKRASAKRSKANAKRASSAPDTDADSKRVPAEVASVRAGARTDARADAGARTDARADARASTGAGADGSADANADAGADGSANAGADSSADANANADAETDADSKRVPAETHAVLDSRRAPAGPRAESHSEHVPAEALGASGTLKRPQRSTPTRFDRADALVAIAEEVVRGTRKDRSPIEVAITVTRETLQATTSPDPCDVGCFTDGTCVTPAAARRLACDCGVVEVVADENGIPLSVGRRKRTVPPAMKKALLRRHDTCRFPGCTVRVFLEGHHLRHWFDGGKTDLRNIACLCSWHHRYVHEYGYTITPLNNGDLEFRDDRGCLVSSAPRPAKPDNLGWSTIIAKNEVLQITNETPACGWDGYPVDYYMTIDALVRSEGTTTH